MPQEFKVEEPYYQKGQVKHKPILRFDPTIHAGHVMTAITILFCSVGAWYNMREQVDAIKSSQDRQQTQIDRIISSEDANQKWIALEIEKMRDDNKQWFMRLDDKLDRKMDKKGS